MPVRRRSFRFGTLAALALLLTVLTTACVSQKDPTAYSDSVRKNFVTGCVAGYAPRSGGKDSEAAQHRSLCGCIYSQMTDKTGGITFDEFKAAQSAIRKNPKDPANKLSKLIPKFDGFVKTCKSKLEAGPQVG